MRTRWIVGVNIKRKSSISHSCQYLQAINTVTIQWLMEMSCWSGSYRGSRCFPRVGHAQRGLGTIVNAVTFLNDWLKFGFDATRHPSPPCVWTCHSIHSSIVILVTDGRLDARGVPSLSSPRDEGIRRCVWGQNNWKSHRRILNGLFGEC